MKVSTCKFKLKSCLRQAPLATLLFTYFYISHLFEYTYINILFFNFKKVLPLSNTNECLHELQPITIRTTIFDDWAPALCWKCVMNHKYSFVPTKNKLAFFWLRVEKTILEFHFMAFICFRSLVKYIKNKHFSRQI